MTEQSQNLVGIIMGSDSDLPTMEAAIAVCEKFGVSYEVAIVSAHRTPERMVNYARTAHERGIKVIIAGAGGAAHLPGMVASLTPPTSDWSACGNPQSSRNRFSLFDSTDAQGNSCCHSCYWQCSKRWIASSANFSL